MKNKIEILKNKIKSLSISENLVCVLLYGSVTLNSENPDDLDGVVVVKQVVPQIKELFDLIKSYFNKLDFNIYSEYEVRNKISYFTREFKLEYVAKGICLFGENIFKEMYYNTTNKEYKLSILIRSIEHLQMVRQKYFFALKNEEDKFNYLNKYFLRISKNILLFYNTFNHTTVNNITHKELFKKLYDINIFDKIINIQNIKTSDELLILFSLIEQAIYKLRNEIQYEQL